MLDINNRQEKLLKAYEFLEKNLVLLGATAIEDTLQDNLIPTIEKFKSVSIKFWILTGDHHTTAVSIAHFSKIVNHSYHFVYLNSIDPVDLNRNILEAIEKCSSIHVCLVISGQSLNYIKRQKKRETYILLQQLALRCEVVIGTRLSPSQKAVFIEWIKEHSEESVALAIGDGANDVNMISCADVGVALAGREGRQAARNADFVVSKFACLLRLLFVHGRESYRKNSYVILYITWKNFIYILPIIIFGFHCQFSPQSLYDPYLDILFNIVFTSIPIIWYAVSDLEVNHEELEANPKFYLRGMQNKSFNYKILMAWVLFGLVCGLIVFYSTCYVLNDGINTKDKLYDLWCLGTTMYLLIIITVNLKIFFGANSHNLVSILLLIGSLGMFVGTVVLTEYVNFLESFGVFDIMLYSDGLIFLLGFAVPSILLYFMAYKFAAQFYHNKDDEAMLQKINDDNAIKTVKTQQVFTAKVARMSKMSLKQRLSQKRCE